MYDEIFNKSFANAEQLVQPMVKANKLAVTNFEKLVSFQMNAMQTYVDMGLEQLKAAAEVNSPQSFQSFWSKQVEMSNVLRQKVLDDTKALVDLSNGMKDEFTKLAEDNVQEISQAAPKAASKATEAAKKAA